MKNKQNPKDAKAIALPDGKLFLTEAIPKEEECQHSQRFLYSGYNECCTCGKIIRFPKAT